MGTNSRSRLAIIKMKIVALFLGLVAASVAQNCATPFLLEEGFQRVRLTGSRGDTADCSDDVGARNDDNAAVFQFIGTGEDATIQTCETDEDLDTQIEVFDGNSCDSQCLAGEDRSNTYDDDDDDTESESESDSDDDDDDSDSDSETEETEESEEDEGEVDGEVDGEMDGEEPSYLI